MVNHEVIGLKPSDLHFMIGRNGIILKKVILPQNMNYEKGDKPRVNFKVEDEKVIAEITCKNEEVITMIQKNIQKRVDNMRKSIYYMKVPLEKHKVGKLIGAGGIYIDNMKSDIKNNNELIDDDIKISVDENRFIKKGNHSFSIISMEDINHGEYSIIKFELSSKDRSGMKTYLIELVKENLERVYSE